MGISTREETNRSRAYLWVNGRNRFCPERTTKEEAKADEAKVMATPVDERETLIAGMHAAVLAAQAAEEQDAAAETQSVKKKPAQALPQGSVVETDHGKWRLEVKLGRTRAGPGRDTKEEAEADSAKVHTADSREAMGQMITDLHPPPVFEPPVPKPSRAEKRAWHDNLDQQCKDGDFEETASILSCFDLAMIIFDLFTATDKPQTMPQGRPGLKKCLGQLAFLC